MLDHSYLLPDAPDYDPEEHYERVRNNGDIPLVTPLLRAIDSLTLGSGRNRPLRDPAAAVTTPGVDLPLPEK